jgi:hypothetical protein
MATPSELVALVCRETGLDDTVSSDERAIALSSVNRAYRRIAGIEVKQVVPSSADVAAALDIDLSAAVPSLVTLDSVYRVDGSRTLPLDRTSPERLLEMRGGSGTPTAYAVNGRTLMLNAVEDDAPGTLRLRFTARPGALSESDNETAIAGIDPVYHEDLLGTLAVAYVLEGYEGEEERAAYFRNQAQETLRLFKLDQVRRGGVYNPRGDDPTRFDTPGVRRAR